MRTFDKKLGQAFLGLAIVSCLACGDSDKNTGCDNDGGCPDGSPAGLDGAVTPDLPAMPDLAAPSVDLAGAAEAGASVDQAPVSPDQAPPRLDGGANTDAPAADSAPDVPASPDLPWGPEANGSSDLPPSQPDLRPAEDTPPLLDLPLAPDAAPAIDLALAVDAAPTVDVAAEVDASPGLDTGVDADPSAPTVGSDKLLYAPGAPLTATWANGSSSSDAWIGIYPVGGADNAYRDWEWTGGETSGTVLLYVPPTPGTYELRLFANGSSPYVLLASSVPFTVAE